LEIPIDDMMITYNNTLEKNIFAFYGMWPMDFQGLIGFYIEQLSPRGARKKSRVSRGLGTVNEP